MTTATATKYKKAKIPPDLRWKVWERDNYTCQDCGARKHLTVDHIIPESRNGATDMANLQTLCKPCNSAKGPNRPMMVTDTGLPSKQALREFDRWRKVKQFMDAGLSARDIARVLDVTPQQAYNLINKVKEAMKSGWL